MKKRNMSKTRERFEILNREDSLISADFEAAAECCLESESEIVKMDQVKSPDHAVMKFETENETQNETEDVSNEKSSEDTTDGRSGRKKAHPCNEESTNNWAEHKNVAEGLMDIALLSANANQLRFLITYNNKASTYYISLGLVALSLILQVAVGIALIFKRRMKSNRTNRTRTRTRINEFLVGGVFMVTVVNILLAAFTTTDGPST